AAPFVRPARAPHAPPGRRFVGPTGSRKGGSMGRPLKLDDLYAIPFASDPQLSPDGRTVAFVRTQADREADEDRSTIWIVPVSGGEPRELTTGRNDLAPRWSPDGGRLAFVSKRGDGP